MVAVGSLAFLLFSLSLVVCDKDDKDDKGPPDRVFPEGTKTIKTKKGNKIRLHDAITLETPYGKPDYIEFQWGQMNELDANYNLVSTLTINQKVNDWSDPVEFAYTDSTTGEEIVITAAEFHKTLRNGAKLDGLVWIFTTRGGTMSFNGVDFIVPVNSVKISFNVTDWPFQSYSDFLSVGVRLEGWGGRKHPGVRRRKKNHKLNFGIGILESVTSAVYDEIVPGPVDVNCVGPVKDNSVDVEYVFYAFQHVLYYDPVFSIDESSAVGSFFSFSTLFLSILVSFTTSHLFS